MGLGVSLGVGLGVSKRWVRCGYTPLIRTLALTLYTPHPTTDAYTFVGDGHLAARELNPPSSPAAYRDAPAVEVVAAREDAEGGDAHEAHEPSGDHLGRDVNIVSLDHLLAWREVKVDAGGRLDVVPLGALGRANLRLGVPRLILGCTYEGEGGWVRGGGEGGCRAYALGEGE